MPISEDIQWLYDQMSQKGYTVGKSADEFDRVMRANEKTRQAVYDRATAEGLQLGKDVGEFSREFGFVSQPDNATANAIAVPATDTVPQVKQAAMPTVQPSAMQQTTASNSTGSNPLLSRDEMMDVGAGRFGDFARGVRDRSEEMAAPADYMVRKAEAQASEVESQTPAGSVYKPSESDISRFRSKVDEAVESISEESQSAKNIKEYYGRIAPGQRSAVVKGTPVYNAETGEVEDRYLTEEGAAFGSKGAAEAVRGMAVSDRVAQEEVSRIYDAWAKEHPNASVEEKEVARQEAYARQQWHEKMRNVDAEIERLERLAREQDKIAWPATGGEIRRGYEYHTPTERSEWYMSEERQAADKMAVNYHQAAENLRRAKDRYERGEQNVDSNWLADFGRGLGSGVKEMVRNPFGFSSLADALDQSKLKDKIEKGAKLSDDEEAYIGAIIFGQETEQFSKERGRSFNVGESVALLAEMIAEFGLNPASGVTRAAVANSVKAFGKAAAKKVLTRPGMLAKLRAVGAAGTAKAFAPAVGAALGEGAVIAGTTQLPKNYAEMQTRMTGAAERTEPGGYAFNGGEGAGEAFAKSFGKAAGSNAIFLPSLGIKGLGSTMEKAAGKLFGESGAKVAGEMSSWFKFPGKVLPMHNLPEGALKMKTSELLSVMAGDESMADWSDPEKNMETLAVLLAAEFMMGLPQKAVQGKEYHNVARAKYRAAQSYVDAMKVFSDSGKQELFDDFQSRLRTVESPEEAIAALYHGREHLSEPEIKALYDMVGAMFRYKGAADSYNARYHAGRGDKNGAPNDTEGAASGSTEPIGEGRRLRGGGGDAPVDEVRAAVDEVRTDGFAEGYGADDAAVRQDIQSIYEARRETLVEQAGRDVVDMVDALGDEFDISTVDEQLRHSMVDYISARSAWEGVNERINEEVTERISEAEALVDSHTNQSDGMVQEVKLKNNDGFWWLRNGTVNLLDNGEIDRSASSEMVFLVNANGEVKSFALSDIAELGERVSPDVLKAQAREVEENRKAAMGIKDVAEGADNGRDSVTLQHGDADTYGSRPEWNSGGLDLREDGGGMAADNAGGVASTADRGDIRVFEPEVAASQGEHPDGSERNRREAESQRLVEIAKDNGLFIPSDGWGNLGKRQPGRTGESVVYYNEEDGRYYKVKDPYAKSPMKSGVQPEDAIYEHLLHNMYFPETAYRFEGIGEVIGDVRIILSQGEVVAVGQASKEQVEAALAEKGLVPEGKYAYGNDDISVTDVMGENALLDADGKVYFIDPIINVKRPLRDILDGHKTPSAMDRVPKDEAGKPMFTDADPEIAWDAIAEAFPSEASAQEWVGKQLAKAKGALSQLEKGRYEVPDDFAEAARAAQQRASQVAAAKEYASRWEAIAAVRNARAVKAAEEAAAVRRAKEAEAEARRQGALAAQGVNTPHPSIKEKWDKADKVYGHEDEITLADGTTVRGRYVLTEAETATPSHDPTRNFAPSEGFPVDENGNTPNDRDYQRDSAAQQLVRGMASYYDGRATQNPVIVTSDGVVVSGNNRVMSGDEAARMGTDGANIEYQRRYGSRYGFTEDQVVQRKHPRIYFELSEPVPYTTDTFAKFNQSGMKSQSKTETAVKLGKTVSDATFTRLVELLQGFERLNDFYSDGNAGNEALSVLVNDGIALEADLPALRSGEGLSGGGRDLIENILVGKAFDNDPEAVRRLAEIPSMRQIVVTALTEIANNTSLKQSGYDLGDELSKAIGLVYDARISGGEAYAYGKPVSTFGRQMGLFGEKSVKNATVLLLADLLNSKKVNRLRDVIAAYNRRGKDAAAGQLDMFSGDNSPERKEVILKAVLDKFNEYGKDSERDSGAQQTGDVALGNGGGVGEPGREYVGLTDGAESDVVEEPGDGYGRTLFGDEGGGVQRGLFDDINKKSEELVPIGHGVFGKIYDQFKGKVKEAVAFLAKNKNGDLLGVFNRKDFGAVDLVWGDNNGGWSHILSKHVGDGRSFATPEAAAKAIDEIITVGEKVFENGDKVVFRIGNKLVTVRKNLRERGKKIADKNWVLTAYDESAADNGGSAITNVNQAKAAPSTALSDDKSSNSTAEMQGGEAKSVDAHKRIAGFDNQGNPIDEKGNLIVEDVSHINEISDEDFTAPTRNIGLPSLPDNVSDAIGANGRKVVIKKNVFEKNREAHKELTPSDGRSILERALYNPNIVGTNQPVRRPDYKVAIQTGDKNAVAVLDVYAGKSNVEIVGWRKVDTNGLEKMKRQAEREGGQFLILSPTEGSAAALSALPSDVSSINKGNDSPAEMQGGEVKSEDTRERISQAEAQVATNPTEAQKEAGNYRKGHVIVDGHNITIEQPKGSVRRGKDANGKEWETTMNNTYGYIRGTKGVDGDHIDVFLSDDPERGDVFVVDQYNPDGSFDEHKVMYGFGNDAEALSAYLSNYEKGWKHGRRIDITGVSKDDFRKWIDSSTRKTKPFAEYKGMKLIDPGLANKFEYFGGTLGELIDKAKTQATGLIKKIISPVSNRLLLDLAKKGVEIDDGYKHVIDNNAIRHALKKHGSQKELERGQMPITEKDFERIEDVVSNYDKLDTEIGKRGNDIILYSKSYPDGTTIFVEEKRSGRKELAAVTIYKRDNSTLIGANRNEATLIPNLGEVVDKDSEILSVKQAKDIKTPRKIDDFGEKIEGARKDALSRIAKTLDNVTAKALVELPLGKAVSRPDFGKSVDRGEMDERDAMAAEALWQAVYGERKPGNSRKNRTKIARWGEQTAGKIAKLREFLDADNEKRDEIIGQMRQFSFPEEAAEREHYNNMVGWNPDRTFLEPVFTPAPEAVALSVMESVGMRPGDKRKIEFSIKTDMTHQYYEIVGADGYRVSGFGRTRDLDTATERMATAVRIANKDTSVVYPADCFRVVGVDPVMTSTGKFSVAWVKGRYGYYEKQFDSREEAESFITAKQQAGVPASMRELKTRTGEYGSYKIMFRNPVSSEELVIREGIADKIEAQMAIDGGAEGLSEAVNSALAKGLDKKDVGKSSHFFVTTVYDRNGRHFVVARNGRGAIKLGDFQNPAIKEFATRADAEKWFAENSEALERAYSEDLKKRREFVFFKPSKGLRRGVDRRGGRDITPDEFGDMFGFRGVQFGNWTKDADRQMALNEAYDAFLDMADMLGLSPHAMSLNGELGIAFGARGVGGANAHYERVEVVINLTKTRGAGSLAHEWWHAFDNYMMRRGGNPLLFATEALTMDGARKEVAEAFRALSKAITASRYHARSMQRGAEYWGSLREESARLFGEWIVSKLAEKDGANHFLSRGVEPSTMEDYKKLSYWSYQENEKFAGRKPLPYKEWLATTEVDPLGDYPYPTPEELAELGKPMQQLFDTLEERGDNGEVMEPETDYQMSLFDKSSKPVGAMQRSLFDGVEQQASRLPEQEAQKFREAAEIMNEEVDRYNEAYSLYLEQSDSLESSLENYDGDEAGRRELLSELDSYGDQFKERQAETERALTSYFRLLGNTPKDAERMSHDKLAQFRADVEMRRRMLNLRDEMNERRRSDLQSLPDLPTNSPVEHQEMKTAGGELIRFNSFGRIPRAEHGEFCAVERQFTVAGGFSFTGNDRINSADDVAYTFRSLESYAVENTFAMLVKDGRPIIMHLGMGHATASVVDLTAIRVAMDAYGADDLYFVHNHPSGNLRCSVPDTNILKTVNKMVDGKAKVHAIIMDTTSGKYGTFDVDASQEEHVRPVSGGDAAVATYRFDRLNPKKGAPDLGQVRTPDDVTRILTDLRLGSGDKVGVLVLDQSNRVVGNFLTPYADLSRSRELADEATGYAAKHGGTGVILYGNSIDFSAIKDVNAAVTSRSGGHVRMLDVVAIDNGLNRSAQNAGMMHEPRANYGAYVNDGGMKRSATAEAEWRKRMVDERGIVMPGLADKSVNVVEVPRHDFTGEKPISQAREWARKNIVGEHELTDGDGKNVKYTISGKAVDKYLSQSAIGKSENLGVHLSVLKKLPEVIGESIEVEVHPDYKKGEDGVRKPENGASRDNFIHRYYGVANINGGVHRVKTTIAEPNEDKSHLKPHSYEVTKIELLPEDNSSTLEPTTHLKVKTSVGVAKLSNDFEKSNDNGAKNELSSTRNENTAEKRVFSRNGDSSKIGAQESAQAQPIQSLEIAKLGSLISGSETSNALSNSNDGLKKRTILRAAKLLNGVEKSYDKGVKILDASKKEEAHFHKLYDMGDMELPEVHDDSQATYGMEEAVTNSMLRLAEKQADSWKARSDAYRAIGGNLSSILKGMSVQKEYDKQTVKRVTDLAQSMLQNGQMTGLRDGEVKRLLSAVKNANGRKDVRKQVEGIVDIMLASQLRNQEATLDRLLSTRGKKLSPKGIEVAGRLAPGAIAQIATFRKMRMATEDDFNTRMSEVVSDLGSSDADKAERAELEYEALLAAKEYRSDIITRQTEIASLGESMRLSYDEMQRGEISRQAYNEFVESCRRAQRGLRAKMVDAYNPLISKLSGIVDGGRARAGEMVDAEKERVRKIYRMIESDMNWVSSDIHKRELTKTQKVTNSTVAQFLTSTLPTFNEILKTFCPMAPGGEGRIYRHFMDKWVLSTENDYTGRRRAFDTLTEKSAEILNLSGAKWETIGLKARDLKFTSGDKEMSIRFNDSSGEREFGLRVPEVAYIYAVNKMEDGRMKLNKMGLSDTAIEEMTTKLPKEVRDLVDWLQDEFLPSLREKYNAVHLRLFGTEMETVDNYFPLKIHKGSVHRDVDVANPGADNMQSSVTTGAIIKRTRNARPLDLLHCDIFNVVTEHVRDMEHWAAYSELSKDLNTLLSINEFRAKVENMTTIFGSGPKLWEKFSRCCQMATGDYMSDNGSAMDRAAVSMVKFVTTAKVSFMPWTAIKQLTSFPAFFATASVPDLAYAGVHLPKAFKWCLDNLPLFHKRWIGRMMGDEKLLPTNLDISTWRKEWVEKLSKIGMTPNAFVDALTIAWGTYATYNTKYKQYVGWGFSPERAHEKARIDATIAYNETQQSSESAFLSHVQSARTWQTVLLTAFRNSPISYQRKLLSATRDLNNAIAIRGGARQRYMRDRLMEEGLSENQAEKAANDISGRMIMDAVVLGATIGLLALTWNLGGNSIYSIFGSDGDEKVEIAKNDVVHSMYDTMFQGVAGGDVISLGLTALATKGEIGKYDLEKDMPAISDLNRVVAEFGYDNVAAWNSLLNLAVQTGVGVNPRVLSNWVGAAWDVCGHDAQTSQEFTILMLRLLQAPQSQLDKIYFDELNLSGEQAKKCTPMEIAHRYAEYKVRTGSNILFYGMGFTSDETDRDRIKRYEKHAMKVLKSQMNDLYPTEVNAAYDKFKAVHDRLRDQKLGITRKHKSREITVDQMLSAIDRSVLDDPDYEVFVSFSTMDGILSKMASGLIDSQTPEEANSYREALRWFKTCMAEWYSSRDKKERDSIMDEGMDYAYDFFERMEVGRESELDAVNE